jgi:hypothetical protein
MDIVSKEPTLTSLLNMNFIWKIEQLFVKKTEGSFSDVVVTANWNCLGSDGTYSATSAGCTEFAPPSGEFTPYEDLTEQQVLDWCYANGVDKTAIEANVTAQINDQINPPVIAPPLPWLPPEMIVPPMLPQVEPVLVAEEAVVVETPTV